MNQFSGIGVSGFRSFGTDEMQYLRDMDRLNFIAGQNNVGKSNVLRLIRMLVSGNALDELDYHNESTDSPILVSLEVPEASWREALSGRYGTDPKPHLLGSPAHKFGDGSLWPTYEIGRDGKRTLHEESLARDFKNVPTRVRAELAQNVSNTSGGNPLDDPRRIFNALKPLLPDRVEAIPANRRIRPDEAVEIGTDGSGLLSGLLQLSNPGPSNRADADRFARILSFIRSVMENPDLTMTVAHDRKDLIIEENGRRLPLASYGSGIEQVVVLAVAAILHPTGLLTLEEPETNLHPRLQRKLVRFLRDSTENQYVIATHSAHMLDHPEASIHHLSLDEHRTRIRQAKEPSERHELCRDLGYRPSDLIQTNAIVWVEGPSDRIYVNHWLAARRPELIEGIDYSIMFYGGSLLKHLTGEDIERDDPVVDEFIELVRLNRHFVVVIDSDMTSSQSTISPAKSRIIEELEHSADSHTWLTFGYTIENYVPSEILRDSHKVVHPKSAENTWNGSRFRQPFKAERSTSPDKVRIAREVVLRWNDQTAWRHDLADQVDKVLTMIERANDR